MLNEFWHILAIAGEQWCAHVYVYMYIYTHIIVYVHIVYTHCVYILPAACYDSRNHCVWTCNDDWIDVWDCAGKVRVAAHQLASRLGKSSVSDLIPPPLLPHQPHPYSSNSISVSEAISLMLRHVGIESCCLVPGCEFSTTVIHNLPVSFLEQCCDLLQCSLTERSWDNALAVVVTLQAVLPAFLSNDKLDSDHITELKGRVRYIPVHALLLLVNLAQTIDLCVRITQFSPGIK